MQKLCFFCKYCKHQPGAMLSEFTWDSGEIGCRKGYWEYIGDHINLVDVGVQLLKAETCEHYSPAEGIPTETQSE